MEVLGSMNVLPNKRGYKAHYIKLAPVLHDVEIYTRRAEHSKVVSYKGEFPNRFVKYSAYDHIAVVVLTDGRCYVGISRCGRKDQFHRSRGHEIAVGRAMRR